MTTNCEIPQSSKSTNFKKSINLNYKWIVQDFISLIESPLISNEMHPGITWRWKIVPGRNPGYIFFYTVQILVNFNDENEMKFNCKMQILNALPEKNYTYQKNICFTSGTYINFCCIAFRSENAFLQHRHMTITCDMVREMNVLVSHTIPKCRLSNDLELMLKHQIFSDVTLCVSGKDFQAHKGILAARSPVFNAMFKHEMNETKQNKVEITDIDSEVFEQLLLFIYTGEVLNLKTFAMDLLPAANKYGIERLKVLCEGELCTNISIEDASEILVLADIYNLQQLRIMAIGYISSQAVHVIKTDGWKKMITLHSYLVTEIVSEIAQQNLSLLNFQEPLLDSENKDKMIFAV